MDLQTIFTILISPILVYLGKKLIDLSISISRKIDQIEDNISDLRDTVNTFSNHLSTIEDKVDDISSRVTRLEVKIEPIWRSFMDKDRE